MTSIYSASSSETNEKMKARLALWTQKPRGKRAQAREQHLQFQQWGRTGWSGDLFVFLGLSQDVSTSYIYVSRIYIYYIYKQNLINMLRFMGLYTCTCFLIPGVMTRKDCSNTEAVLNFRACSELPKSLICS